MWDQPYLETCCRSALHRLSLAGEAGRPASLQDGRCLERLESMGLSRRRPDGRHELTAAGIARHASEVLRQLLPPAACPPPRHRRRMRR